jgi:hypothetical protein
VSDEVKRDMSLSVRAFQWWVLPVILEWVGRGKFIKMEGIKDSQFATLLDTMAGIDGWLIDKFGMRGVASRIQVCENGKPYNTFTVREERDTGTTTELAKRTIAIETGMYVYPFFTVQAFLTTWDGPSLSVGMTKTVNVIKFIKDGHSYRKPVDNGWFRVCRWDKMQDLGMVVKTRIYEW